MTRKWVVVWGVLGTFAAFVCVFGQKSLLDKALIFTSLFIGPLLGLFLHAFYRPHVNAKAVFSGVVVGMLGLFLIQNNSWFLVEPFKVSPLWNPMMSLMLMSATIAVLDPILRQSQTR